MEQANSDSKFGYQFYVDFSDFISSIVSFQIFLTKISKLIFYSSPQPRQKQISNHFCKNFPKILTFQ